MILSRQIAEMLLVFPPIINYILDFVSFDKFLPNIIRATNFIEESDTGNDIEGLLIRIKLRNCLHDIELSLCKTSFRIVSKKELKPLYQFACKAAEIRLVPYGSE